MIHSNKRGYHICGDIHDPLTVPLDVQTTLTPCARMSSDPRFCNELLREEFGVREAGLRLRIIEELHRLFA